PRISRPIADSLIGELRKHGLRPWIDRRNLRPSEEWRLALRRGVATRGMVLFFLKFSWLAAKKFLEEVDWWEKFGKRIIPLLIEEVHSDKLPSAVAKRQFIQATVAQGMEPALSDTAISEVVAPLRLDPNDVRIHRDLLARALEWRAHGNDAERLL